MKRKNLNQAEQKMLKLQNIYLTGSALRQIEILRLLNGLIENLIDADLKDFFINFRDYLVKLAKPIDLEQTEHINDDHSEFFELVAKDQAETIRALEEIKNPDV